MGSGIPAEQRRARAQIAAHTRWAKEDPAEQARRGQAGLMARFAREVDPDNALPEAERERRVESMRRAHMARLVLARHKSRAANHAVDNLAAELGEPGGAA